MKAIWKKLYDKQEPFSARERRMKRVVLFCDKVKMKTRSLTPED